MTLMLAPMDSYRVFQRDTTSGNPPGGTTDYGKGWGEVDLSVSSDTTAETYYRIRDAQDPTRIIQNWSDTGQQTQVGTCTLKLEIPASEDCYLIDVSTNPDFSTYTTTVPLFMGNIDAAAGQSKATGFFGSYAYAPDDPRAQPSQYVQTSFSTRVFTSDSMPRWTDAPTAWVQPGDYNTPGGAAVTTFAAQYLDLRQAELGVACALIGDSRPGGSVAEFAPGGMYGQFLDAIVARAGGKISDFIWNQGDADWTPSAAANYQAEFQSVVNALDAVTTTPYRVIAFDYTWIGGAWPDRTPTEVDLAKQAVATAHGGSYLEGVSAGDQYFGGHPTMLSRMLAADDVYRQILALENPAEDKGPQLTGVATRTGTIVDLQVQQDKGSTLVGETTEYGTTSVSFRQATPDELSGQFSAFEHGYTDATHRIAVVQATLIGANDIELTLASMPTTGIDVWYRADYDGQGGDSAIRDNFTADGINFGVGLQTRLTPVLINVDGSSDSGSATSASQSPSTSSSAPLSYGASSSTAGNNSGGSTGSSTGSGTSGTTSTTTTTGTQGSSPNTGTSASATTGSASNSDTSGLVLQISEDAWQGDAQYTIKIDGQQVGAIHTASASHSSGQSESISVPTQLTPGDHTVTVDFLNDAYGGSASADRNLYVDGMTLNGASVVNGSARLAYGGPVSFSVSVPNGSSSTGAQDGSGSSTGSSTGSGTSGTTSTTTTTGTQGSSPNTGTSASATTGSASNSDTSGLVLQISEDAWQGDAQYTIKIDGQQVGAIHTASASHSSGQSESISVPTQLTPGDHTVTVDFLNDAYGGSASADRNLYVDGMTLNGASVVNGSARLAYGGPVSFSVSVPNGSSSTGAQDGSGSSTGSSTGSGTSGTTSTTTTTGTQGSSPNTGTSASATTGSASNSDTSGLVLQISEDAWQGDAQYTIKIDGQQVGAIHTASASHSSGQSESISVPTQLTPGDHTVTVDFLNDAYGGSASADRNLYVDGMTLNGASVVNGSARLAYGGPVSVSVSVPNGSSSTGAQDGSGSSTGSSTGSGTSGTTSTTTTTGTQGSSPNTGTSASATTGSASNSDTSGLVLQISEDAWQGDAQYTIKIDGQQVGAIHTASASHSSGQSESISVPTQLTPGDHTVTVDFLNDAYGGSASADRNLYVDGMTLNGASVVNGSARLAYGGPVSFSVSVPNGSSSTGAQDGSGSSTGSSTGSGTSGTTSTTTTVTSNGGSSAPGGSGNSSSDSGGASSMTLPDVSGAGLLTAPAVIDTTGHNVLTVGVGKGFSTIAAAVAASHDGDIILVDAGSYVNDFTTTTHKITMVGVGGQVNMSATVLCPNDKAILTVDNDLTLENFTFSGAKVADGNGAGIRYEGGSMTLVNDAFFNNENGILGAPGNGTISISHSLFSGNGSGTGYTHNLYIGQNAELDVSQSVFEGAKVGHELKSRALVNNIINNVIQDGSTGTASYDIDLPNGGTDVISGNLIEKGPDSENNTMVHFGGEGLPYASSSLTITGNLFTNDKSASTIALTNATAISATVSNNIFQGISSDKLAAGAANLSNNRDQSGQAIGNATISPFSSTDSVVYTDAADHVVVLDGNPLLNVRGGSGHLTVVAVHGDVMAFGGEGGMTFSEQPGSGANQLQTAAGSVNSIQITGQDTLVSRGTDEISTGQYDVQGTISGTAHVQSGTAYDKWTVSGTLNLNIDGGGPTVTITQGAQASITGNASGLNLSSTNGSVSVDLTQSGGDYDGEEVSFSATGGSTSASLWDGKVAITTAPGVVGSAIHLGAGIEQLNSNGADEIWAGTGNDTVVLSNGSAIVHASSGSLAVYGRGIAADTQAKVFGNGGDVLIDGDTGNISYYGDDHGNTVTAALSNISLNGGDGRMTVHAKAFSQTIVGSSGGVDYDTVGDSSGSITTASNSVNHLMLGNNSVNINSSGTDTISGGRDCTIDVHGNASIDAGFGHRHITLMGDDTVNASAGDSIADAGAGSVNVVIQADGVTVSGGSGRIAISQDTVGHEGLQFTGGSGAATVNLGMGGSDVIFGTGTTSASISGGNANTFEFSTFGTGGANTITGFRTGVDRLSFHDSIYVTSSTISGGGTAATLTLSNSSTLNLVNLVGGTELLPH